MARKAIRGLIETHPKATSLVFTTLLLLTQVQAVLAEGSGANGG